MKLLVLILALASCQGQQDLPREVKWDYSEWQPILTPCATCRQSRILEAKPTRISTVSIGKPALQNSGKSVQQNSGKPVLQNSGKPVLQNSGKPVLQNSGRPVLQNSGRPVLQNSGRPVLQNSGRPVLQNSGGPVLQNFEGPVQQNSGRPVLQNSEGPVLQNSGGPVVQNSGEPVLQNSLRPVLQNSGGPVLQNSGEPVLQNSGRPVLQNSGGPVLQNSGDTSSVIQLQPVFQTNIPKIKSETLVESSPPALKTNPSEIKPKNLVPFTPPRTPAISFPPTRNPVFLTTPAVQNTDGINQVRLVYLPEGSIHQLSSANAARIIPTSQTPNQILESIDSIPPLPSPQVIQSIDFSDKQKRDHEGRIVSGGTSNSLPMSLITTRGHENDAREKLKLLEAALSAPIEQNNEKLPRVFIAPSHVPPPPGYVKIPLVPQGKSESQGNENEALPTTFLTPDSRNPPPGFIKFDLPSTVSKLSKDIPVVVPNSQVEPNVIFNGPRFSPTPGSIRPDASLNFQAQNVRTGKNIVSSGQNSQSIPKEEPKPTIPPKFPSPSDQADTKPNPLSVNHNALRPIPQRPAPHPQNSFQSQFFPPRQPSNFPQQSLPNLNQPHPFAQRPGQPPFSVFPGQPAVQPGQHLSHSTQLFPRPGQQFVQHNPSTPRPGQQFVQHNPSTPRPGQQFVQHNPSTPRPGQQFVQHNPSTPRPESNFVQQNQAFSNHGIPRPLPLFSQTGQPINQQFLNSGQPSFNQGQPVLQPGQGFPRIIQHFQHPNQPLPHHSQRPFNNNPNQSIFRSPNAPVRSDFPSINSHSGNQPENSNHVSTSEVPQPTTPVPSPSSSQPTIPPFVNTPQPIPKSVVQNTPRPQLITPFTQKQFPSSSPNPTGFFQSSPRPFPTTESPVFPQRPTSFSTPISSSRNPSTITPVPVSLNTDPAIRGGFPSTERPVSFTTPAPFTTPEPVSFTTSRIGPFTTPKPISTGESRPTSFTTPNPVPFTTPRPAPIVTQRPSDFSTPRPAFFTTPRPILTSSQPAFSSLNPQPVTFSPLPLFEISSPTNPFQQSFGLENTELEALSPLPHEHQNIDFSEAEEPRIPFIQDHEIQSGQPQNPIEPQSTPVEGSVTVRIPSFQRPQTTTLTRFPGPQSPRIPAFQRPSASKVDDHENSKEIQEPGRRQRLPLFPRFQKARVTTILPEEEDQTLQPEIFTTEFIPTTTPSTLSTSSQPTTVKVTTFKPKFNFNLGNRRPFFRRKQRPTEDDDKKDKEGGNKKPEPVTLFPPFSVARTLNPQRDEKNDAGSLVANEPGVTVPPTGTFGRRIRPRTKSPTVRSNDESDVESPRTSGIRARGPVGNKARELPDWLKARRRVQGRFRGTSTTTESIRVVDSVLEDDIPLDAIENNEFSGAESTLVVFSRPLENVVSEAVIDEETEKELIEEGEVRYEEKEHFSSDNEQVDEVITDYSDGNSSIQHEFSASPEDNVTSVEAGVSTEPQDAADSYEDYTYESTEPVPEPEPESSNKYVVDYNTYEDDTEDTPETYNTHDQPRRQPPSFPNPQPTQETVIHTFAHSHPLIIPKNPSLENSEINPLETSIDHTVDEVEDATERYVGNESSDENELLVLPLDKETDELDFDNEVNVENEYDSVTKRTSFSNENNSSEIYNETHQLGGEGEEGADGEMDGESQDHREDSYQEYNTESPEILTLFPNDYFTALSPGQMQEYDYYEYDSYEDEGSTEGDDQSFGGSSAQVVFAVPVTEYSPEDTTFIQENFENMEENEKTSESEVAVSATEVEYPMTTETFELGMEGTDITTEYPSLFEDEPVTEFLMEDGEVTPYYNIATEIPEEEVPVSTLDYSDSFEATTTITADSTTRTVPPATSIPVLRANTSSTTTARPASIRPLYARLQSIGKKEAEVAIKKLSRHPKILGQSTVTEIRSSEPIICFRDNQCVRARGQRRRRNFKP
ncbi:mucin-2-like [Palaemon carinicauda]|uniref:mucin-2-like n=1 Tax=Palaemon carinicauda TaxID=392227 RepID=UPI0035B6A514